MNVFAQSVRRRFVDQDLYRYRGLLTGRILDLGGGRTRGTFPHGKELQWIVLDEDTSQNPTVVGDAQQLPFRNGVFGGIKCSELTGYLFEPFRMVQEISRVLKDGGIAVITSPFLTPFDSEQHDVMRLTSVWWRWVAHKLDLKIIEISPQGFLFSVLSDMERYWISHWWFPFRYTAYLLMYPIYEALVWWERHVGVSHYLQRFTTGFVVVLKKSNR